MNRAWLAFAGVAMSSGFALVVGACSGTSESSIPNAATSSSSGSTSSTSGGASGNASSGNTSGGGSSGASSGGTSSGAVDAGNEGGGTPCTWSRNVNPCGPGMYCQASGRGNGCGEGVCAPVAVAETQNRTPVCGCDGVTYWNETVAAKNGMSIRKQPGECSNAGGGGEPRPCGGLASSPCPPGASCNHRVPSKDGCGVADGVGACWMLPAQCPQALPQVSSRPCGPTLPPGPTCKDECSLIRSQQTWYPDNCP